MGDNATFAAGEEKTITQFPRGFGYRYAPRDPWLLNYMLPNLEPNHAQVYLTWDIDFLPAPPAPPVSTKPQPQHPGAKSPAGLPHLVHRLPPRPRRAQGRHQGGQAVLA